MSRQYDAFYFHRFPGGDEEIKAGRSWLDREAAVRRLLPVAIGPTRSHFERGGPLTAFTNKVRCETVKSFTTSDKSRDMAILAVWPDKTLLGRIDTPTRVKVVCVIPAAEADIRVWRDARGAVDLLGLAPPGQVPTLHPVVEAALHTLVDLYSSLIHPSDKERAIEIFEALEREGGEDCSWVSDDVEAWIWAHGWSASEAEDVREIADGVKAGRRFRHHGRVLREDIVDLWRGEAEGMTTE